MRVAGLAVIVAACTQTRTDERPRAPAPPVAPSSRSAPALQATAVPATAVPATPRSCVDDGEPYDTQVLSARLELLASPELDGRAPGTAGDRAARAYIVERFRCLGLTAAGATGGYEQPFEAGGARSTANVIGYIAGSDVAVGSEIILIGAHHDHIGDGHLGANDNASGVTALLSIAQAFKQKGVAPRRTLAFVAFGAEEQGMVGSTFYAANAPAALPLGKVVQFINLDMVGSHASNKYVAAMGTFARMPSRALLAKLDDAYPKLNVGLGGRAYRSDHLPFCNAGIPYVFFWTPDARCYHETCDTAKAIDLPRMGDIASLAADLAWGLAHSDVDLAASRAKLGCHAR